MVMSKCTGCGAEIRWINTLAGKPMPVDDQPLIVAFDPASKESYINRRGRVIHGRALSIPTDPDTYADDAKVFVGYTPHWATCPQAASFRTKRREHHEAHA
jgi:hypothetical protein